MSVSAARFQKAVEIIQSLPQDGPVQTSQDDRLFFYKYYKQATVGDVNTPRPGLLDFVGKAKWDAWKSVEGTPQDEARTKYVERLLEILKAHGGEESKQYIAAIEAA